MACSTAWVRPRATHFAISVAAPRDARMVKRPVSDSYRGRRRLLDSTPGIASCISSYPSPYPSLCRSSYTDVDLNLNLNLNRRLYLNLDLNLVLNLYLDLNLNLDLVLGVRPKSLDKRPIIC